SNRAKISELHTMVNDGDVMKMRRVDNLVIPANGELILQPGADHIMFFELDKGWRLGDTIELELLFAKYPSQKISAVVE
ncbi:MAG: copper chaperone PCu(A)C, partial [Planctomycetota bacterium]|nr:copper chaperone PCu(A)C [Planctomycetota bacterium]